MKLINIVTEGGFAVAQYGVGKIAREHIPATIQYVSKLAGIPVADLHPLGSVGKKALSGDIDLAVDVTKYDPQAVHARMMQGVGGEGELNTGTKIGSYAVPIQGSDGKVQVDLMFVSSTKWASFAYHSAGDDSQYKGAIRTILLMSAATMLNEPGTDHVEYDNGELIIRAGRTLDLSSGVRRIFQYRPTKQSGGYLKTMKSISLDKFQQMFPDIEIDGTDVIIADPTTVVEMIFGKGTKPEDVQTAEQVIALIKRRFSKADQQEIFSRARNRTKAVAGKMDLPPELG